jgi:hypothetical protein
VWPAEENPSLMARLDRAGNEETLKNP